MHFFLILALFAPIVVSYLPAYARFTRRVLTLSSTVATPLETSAPTDEDTIINITEKARKHLETLKKDANELYLRMGVRSGGCSGMSYIMDVIEPSAITEEDQIVDYENIKCVVDPKSLLYLYGLELDYSDELIGGGFKFQNPNAETSW